MTEIWIQDVEEFDWDKIDIRKWVLPERIDRADRLKNKSGKKVVLMAEYLLNRVICEKKEKGQLPREMEKWTFPLQYQINAWGAPYFPGNPLFFNWSHSGQYVALALSEYPVGIDIQKRKAYKMSLAEKFFPQEIVELLKKKREQEQERVFFQFWTLLEAWLKAKGTGFYEFSFPNLSEALTEEGEIKQEGVIGEKEKKWRYQFCEKIEEYELCLVEKI